MVSSLKNLFIISPIGEKDTSIRIDADKLFSMIEPIAKKHIYNPIRSDKKGKPGLITREIFEEILSSDLIIADLTCLNPNVLYELGICHTLDKSVILMKNERDEKPLPFDTRNHNTIFYSFDDFKSAQNELEKQIKNIENNKTSFNPIENILKSEILSAMFNNFYKILERMSQTTQEIKNFSELDAQYSVNNNYYAESNQYIENKKLLDEIKKSIIDLKNNED